MAGVSPDGRCACGDVVRGSAVPHQLQKIPALRQGVDRVWRFQFPLQLRNGTLPGGDGGRGAGLSLEPQDSRSGGGLGIPDVAAVYLRQHVDRWSQHWTASGDFLALRQSLTLDLKFQPISCQTGPVVGIGFPPLVIRFTESMPTDPISLEKQGVGSDAPARKRGNHHHGLRNRRRMYQGFCLCRRVCHGGAVTRNADHRWFTLLPRPPVHHERKLAHARSILKLHLEARECMAALPRMRYLP